MQQPSKAQLEALLQYASMRLGVPAEKLASAAADGGYNGLVSSLSENSRRTLESLLGDPRQLEALLASPQVRELLKRL
ncbi:MAG: hypothetical protein IJC52_05685 [Clostridia bacterium]|nr:hypothetical protein [Clostridia bacterium]